MPMNTWQRGAGMPVSRYFLGVVALSLAVVAVLFADWATNYGLRHRARLTACHLFDVGCFQDIPVLVRRLIDDSRPISLHHKKVAVVGAASADSRFERDYQHRIMDAVQSAGGVVVLQRKDADLQIMLAYEDESTRMPPLPGWGHPTKLVAFDLSRVVRRDTRLEFVQLRQVHFFSFGSFVSHDQAVPYAVETFFGELATVPNAALEKKITTMDFRRNRRGGHGGPE